MKGIDADVPSKPFWRHGGKPHLRRTEKPSCMTWPTPVAPKPGRRSIICMSYRSTVPPIRSVSPRGIRPGSPIRSFHQTERCWLTWRWSGPVFEADRFPDRAAIVAMWHRRLACRAAGVDRTMGPLCRRDHLVGRLEDDLHPRRPSWAAPTLRDRGCESAGARIGRQWQGLLARGRPAIWSCSDATVTRVRLSYSRSSPRAANRRRSQMSTPRKLATTRMGGSEQFKFKGWNDEGRLLLRGQAGGFQPAREVSGGVFDSRRAAGFVWQRLPLSLEIHRSTPVPGYGVVMIDFHGSTGYGQAFTDSISKHWGDRPFEDLQKGLAAALERFPWLDGERVRRPGRVLRRLHDQLDRGELARPFPLPGQPRRQPLRAVGLLRHRGTLVPGMGTRRAGVGAGPSSIRSTIRSTTSATGRRRCW